MTLQRLQIQTEAQQLLGQTGCEGASAFFHGFDVLAIDTQCTGLSAGWRRAFGLNGTAISITMGATSGGVVFSVGGCAAEISGATPINIRASSGNPCLSDSRRV